MENLISKLKRKKSELIKIILITMLFFGTNVFFAFSTDTFATFANGFEYSAFDMATRNGRPIMGLIYELHYLSGLSNNSFYYISTALALLFLAVSIWLYQKILAKHELNENTRILVSFASIANIFIIEYFMFIEKCGFMLAVLLNIVAVYFIENFFEKKNPKYIVATLITMTLAIFTYQGTIALFVILSIPFAFKYAKGFRDYVVNIVYIGFSYAFPVLVDMVAFKFVFKSARILEKIDFAANFKKIIHGLLGYSVSTFDILPRYLFLTLFFLVLAAGVFLAMLHKRKLLCVLNIFVIVLASVVFSTATILQGSGWWSARTTYPIASVVGALAVHLLISSTDLSRKNKKVRAIQFFSIFVIGILLVDQYFSFNKIYIDKYKLNALDEYRYNYVGQAISEYQESTGTEVTKVSFYNDASRTSPAYPHLYSQGDLVVSAFYTEWSDITALNYYLNSEYIKGEPLDKYAEYFASKDWNQLSKEQLIFEGNALHLCVY